MVYNLSKNTQQSQTRLSHQVLHWNLHCREDTEPADHQASSSPMFYGPKTILYSFKFISLYFHQQIKYSGLLPALWENLKAFHLFSCSKPPSTPSNLMPIFLETIQTFKGQLKSHLLQEDFCGSPQWEIIWTWCGAEQWGQKRQPFNEGASEPGTVLGNACPCVILCYIVSMLYLYTHSFSYPQNSPWGKNRWWNQASDCWHKALEVIWGCHPEDKAQGK